MRLNKKLFKTTLASIKKSEISTRAAALSFTTVLSIVPVLAISFSVFKLFGGFDYAYNQLMPFILAMLSEGSGEMVQTYLEQFIKNVQASTVGIVGFIGLFITLTLTYLNVNKAFQKIWEVEKTKPIHHRILRVFLLLTLGPILLTLSIVISTTLATQLQIIPYISYLLAYALTYILYVLLYSLVPSERIPLKTILVAAIVPSLMLELAKVGYAIYTKKMVSYSTFYGSFAAIPLFLIWIYIAWNITLLGAVWIRVLHKKN